MRNNSKILSGILLSTLMIILCSTAAFAAPKYMPDGTVFDAEYYALNNPDVVSVYGTDEGKLYQHYLNYGKKQKRWPFDVMTLPEALRASVLESINKGQGAVVGQTASSTLTAAYGTTGSTSSSSSMSDSQLDSLARSAAAILSSSTSSAADKAAATQLASLVSAAKNASSSTDKANATSAINNVVSAASSVNLYSTGSTSSSETSSSRWTQLANEISDYVRQNWEATHPNSSPDLYHAGPVTGVTLHWDNITYDNGSFSGTLAQGDLGTGNDVDLGEITFSGATGGVTGSYDAETGTITITQIDGQSGSITVTSSNGGTFDFKTDGSSPTNVPGEGDDSGSGSGDTGNLGSGNDNSGSDSGDNGNSTSDSDSGNDSGDNGDSTSDSGSGE